MRPAEVVAVVMPNRKGLVQAIKDTAKLVAPSAQADLVADQLGSALEQLASTWAAHVAETEAPEGLLADLVTTAPRLCPAVEELRHDHGDLSERLQVLRLRVTEEKTSTTSSTRWAIRDLLDQLIHHDQVGAELVWDAYNLDLGGGG